MGSKSSVKREDHTTGDSILTYQAGSGEEIQALVEVDSDGVVVTKRPDIAGSANYVHTPAADTAAVVTLAAAGAGICNIVHQIVWSYSEMPTSGNLKVKDGATTIFSVDVTVGGPGPIRFEPGIKGTVNTAMTITLAAGGGTCVGKVNVIPETR
jgi:hypothetical protein